MKQCLMCGVEMVKPPKYSHKQWSERNYCSNKCAAKKLRTGYIKNCKHCGAEFYFRPSMKVGEYCSSKCSATGKANCLGKTWKVKDTSKMKGRILTETARDNISLGQIRRRDRDGRKVEKNRCHHYRDRAYLEWRSGVFERDNYTCQECGDTGVYIEAHHILPWAFHPEKRLELSNGLTVCKPCHKKLGWSKNKEEVLC